MASVNDLILESNVRERLYPAMPFKIFILYSTANETICTILFLRKHLSKDKTNQRSTVHELPKKATGKFMKVVWNHTATNWEPAF